MRIPRSPPRLLSLLLLAMVALASYFAGLASHSNFILHPFLDFTSVSFKKFAQLDQNWSSMSPGSSFFPSNLKCHCACLILQIGLSKYTLPWEFRISAEKGCWCKLHTFKSEWEGCIQRSKFVCAPWSFYMMAMPRGRLYIWMLQFFLSHLAAVLCFLMQLCLSALTLKFQLGKGCWCNLHTYKSQWDGCFHGSIYVFLPWGIYILHGRRQCQEGYEHAPANSSSHLASEGTFYTTICFSLFHLPLEISSRNPSQRSTVGNWWS